jgi:hypothetical protein
MGAYSAIRSRWFLTRNRGRVSCHLQLRGHRFEIVEEQPPLVVLRPLIISLEGRNDVPTFQGEDLLNGVRIGIHLRIRCILPRTRSVPAGAESLASRRRRKRGGQPVRVRVTELEGSAEELRPYLVELLHLEGPDEKEEEALGLPEDLSRYLDDTIGAAGVRRDLTERLLSEVLSVGTDIEYKFAKSKGGAIPQSVRLYRRHSGKGAFLLLFPQRMRLLFRLQAEEATGHTDAWARSVDPRNVYQINLAIRSTDSVRDARDLAGKAYSATETSDNRRGR